MDLRLAVRKGLLVLPERGLGGVRVAGLEGRVLRYDPALSPDERRPLVLAELKKISPR